MRLLSSEHWAAITDPQTWWDNPFFQREAHRDRKRLQPVKAFAWMSLVIAVFVVLTIWGISALYSHGYANAWFVGGDIGVTLVLVVSIFNLTFVTSVAQKHTVRFLVLELSQDTLSSLLTLPLSTFQILFESLVYPWFVAMRMAVVLLPVYVFCVALGGVTWLDVLMLYVVFGLSAVSLPRWNRPLLGESSSNMTALVQPTAFKLDTTNQSPTGQGRNNVQSFGQWTSIAFLLPMFSILTGIGTRTGFANFASLRNYVPGSILVLLPISVISWPLILARGLITPFDWFGFPVIPLPFVLVAFVANRYTQLVAVSEWMQVGTYRDLAKLPTYLGRRRLEGAVRIGQLFAATGYLWRWGVWDGGLSFVVPRSVPGAPGLPGFVYLLLGITLIGRCLLRADALAGWIRAARGESEDRAVRALQVSTTLRYLVAPFVFALGYYLACCAVSRTAPFPPTVCILAGEMLAIGVTGMLLRFGATYGLGTFSLIGMLILPLAVYKPEARPLLVLSPAAGLLRLGNPGLFSWGPIFANAPAWWHWLPPGALGGALAVIAWIFSRWTTKNARPVAGIGLDPTQYGPEVFQDGATTRKTTSSRIDTPVGQLLIGAMESITDNAVAVKEMRARIRGKLHSTAVQRIFLLFAAVTLTMGIGIPWVASIAGPVSSVLFAIPGVMMGGTTTPRDDWANVLSCWYVALGFLSLSTGVTLLPMAFAVEREKSTLGFLLNTPMSAFSIVAGKAAGLMVSVGTAVWAVSLWTLLLSVVLSPLLGFGVVMTAWVEAMVTSLAIYGTVGMVAIAVSALFPGIATVKTSGFIQAITIYACIFVPPIFAGAILGYLRSWGLEGIGIWFALLGIAAIVTGVAFLLAVWSILRMRKRDLATTQTQRGS